MINLRTLALCATLALAGGSLAAQSTTDFSKFRFGLNLSPSLSWINTDDSRIAGNGTALGLKLATQAEFFFAENYAIETGIGFHFNMGGTLLSDYGGQFFTRSLPAGGSQPFNNPNAPTAGGVSLDYAIQYLEIPLGLRLHTRDFGYLRYYVQAPLFVFGIRTNAMGKISGGGVPGGEDDLNIKSEVRPFAMSWGFGGGAEYEVGGGTRLVGGLQFQRLFTDVTKDKDYTYSGRTNSSKDPKASINSLTLRLGVLF